MSGFQVLTRSDAATAANRVKRPCIVYSEKAEPPYRRYIAYQAAWTL